MGHRVGGAGKAQEDGDWEGGVWEVVHCFVGRILNAEHIPPVPAGFFLELEVIGHCSGISEAHTATS